MHSIMQRLLFDHAVLLMVEVEQSLTPQYEVRIFSVSENEENGLGDEGADGAMFPRILGLEPPLC